MSNEHDNEAASGGSALTGGLGMLPKEPSMGLLVSMALRYDHGLAIPNYYDTLPVQFGPSHKQKFEAAIVLMKQIYEEVSGNGFYSPEKDGYYASMFPNVQIEGLADHKATPKP